MRGRASVDDGKNQYRQQDQYACDRYACPEVTGFSASSALLMRAPLDTR